MDEIRRMSGPRIRRDVDPSLQIAFAQVQRGQYDKALPVLRQYYASLSAERMPLEWYSYYAVCLAAMERQFAEAIRLCKVAIDRNELHGLSYANLARVYMLAGSRRKAIETIEHGIILAPDSPALLRVRSELGYRRSPVIPFLSRDNTLNIILGRARHRREQRKHKAAR